MTATRGGMDIMLYGLIVAIGSIIIFSLYQIM